ncbi:MAG: hypothetical protein ACTSR8_20390 [Promethearchaeota archaeon]
MVKKKHKFSKEEKDLIFRMKSELAMMGIPKDQWGVIIQDALKSQQKFKIFSKRKEREGGIGGAVQRVRNKIEERIQKVISKRYNKGGSIEDIFGDLDDDSLKEGMEFMNNLLFGAPPDIKNISNHGTFLGERSDKKRIIVYFDEEENKDIL